jgi:hypothetical protein
MKPVAPAPDRPCMACREGLRSIQVPGQGSVPPCRSGLIQLTRICMLWPEAGSFACGSTIVRRAKRSSPPGDAACMSLAHSCQMMVGQPKKPWASPGLWPASASSFSKGAGTCRLQLRFTYHSYERIHGQGPCQNSASVWQWQNCHGKMAKLTGIIREHDFGRAFFGHKSETIHSVVPATTPLGTARSNGLGLVTSLGHQRNILLHGFIRGC